MAPSVLGLGTVGTVSVFADTEAQIFLLYFISAFPANLSIYDRGQEPHCDVQGALPEGVCSCEDEFWDFSYNSGSGEKESPPASGSHELGMVLFYS